VLANEHGWFSVCSARLIRVTSFDVVGFIVGQGVGDIINAEGQGWAFCHADCLNYSETVVVGCV